MRLQLEGKLLAGIVFVCLIVAAVAAIGVTSTRRMVRDAHDVSRTHDLRVSLRELSRRVDATEGDVRGYLLTGESSYVARLRVNMAAGRDVLRTASALAADDTVQVSRLSIAQRLIVAGEAAFDSTVRLGVAARGTSAAAAERLTINEQLTARIDSLIAAADTSEENLLRLRLAEQSRSELFVTATSIAAVLGLIGLAAAFARSIHRDIAGRRRRAEHEHALAVAGERLAQTTDYAQTLVAVADLPVPQFGDWAVLHVVEESESGMTTLRPIPSRCADDTRSRMLAEFTAHAIDLDSADAAVDIVRTRRLEIYRRVPRGWIGAHSDDTRRAELAQALGMQSLILAPIVARDRALGVWTIGARRVRAVDREAETLIGALANRAALAIENASALLRAQRAAAARDNVLSIVSHDLRNPLSAVTMLSHRLVADDLPAGERRAVGSQILTSVEWMHRLMQDLVDVASIEAGRLSVEPETQLMQQIADVAMQMFRDRAAAQSIMLRSEMPPDLPAVTADAERIIQVLANLLGNAMKFTPSGGVVTVGARHEWDEVQVWVRDTGVGIPPTDLPHVFDRFWHARRNGSARGAGLGLAIAQGIIRAHGGRMWVESAVGRGSTFFIALPVAVPVVARADA